MRSITFVCSRQRRRRRRACTRPLARARAFTETNEHRMEKRRNGEKSRQQVHFTRLDRIRLLSGR